MDNMDSIEVRIPDEIREYKEKYGGFTFRQWIGIVLVAVVCVPTYYVLFKHTAQTFAMIVTTIVAAPIGLIFFIPINGMNAEKMIPYFKRMFIDFGVILKFKTESEMEVEKELLGDKKYQKQMKKLKKMEKKNQKRIERGSASEENEKLRSYRAEVDAYYNALRKEKIDQMISSKVSDVALAVNRKEQKKLKKETTSRQKENRFAMDLSEDETGYPREEGLNEGEYAYAYQADSMRSSLDDKESIVMPTGGLDSNEYTTDFDEELGVSDSSCKADSLSKSLADRASDGNRIAQERIVSKSDVAQKDTEFEETDSSTVEDTNGTYTSDNIMSYGNEANCDLKQEDGLSKTETVGGSGLSKRQLVLQFYRTHPNATKADCKAATGVEMKTIKRCWPKD